MDLKLFPVYIVAAKKEVYFFADTTVNVNPTSEQLAEIAISAADTVKNLILNRKLQCFLSVISEVQFIRNP